MTFTSRGTFLSSPGYSEAQQKGQAAQRGALLFAEKAEVIEGRFRQSELT